MIKRIINAIIELKIEFATRQKLRKMKKIVKLSRNKHDGNYSYSVYWSKFRKRPLSGYDVICGGINGIDSEAYVPENIYYSRIEPILNNKVYATSYADKNFYERIFPDYKHLFPSTVLRGINGNLYDSDFNHINDIEDFLSTAIADGAYVLKPATETGGGNNVIAFEKRQKEWTLKSRIADTRAVKSILEEKYHFNFILQQRITSDKWFQDFNSTSLNTIRINTYRSVINNMVYPLHAVLRFGMPGSIVDNQAAGGFTIGINKKGGLNNFAIDKYGNKYKDIPVVISKSGDNVPHFREMIEIAKILASRYYFQRLLGFDFCLDDSGRVRLLEINCKNLEINFLQLNNGPLFGDLTQEVIEYCTRNKKSIVLDYYV